MRAALLVLAPLLVAASDVTPDWFRQAAAAIENDRLVEAGAVLARDEAGRDPIDAARLRARLLSAEGRHKAAVAILSRPELAGRLDCADKGFWLKSAVAAASADAETLGETIAQACSADADIWLARAVLADRQARWDVAEAFYARAAELAPDSRLVFVNRGYSLILQRRFQEAETLIAAAVRRWPDDRTLQNNWDLARGALGLAPEPRSGESVERRAERLNNAGYAALLAGRREEARALLTRALETGDRASRTTLANWARAEAR